MVLKYDLSFQLPLMNAAGSLGFAPDPHGPADLKRFGAFVTNPISLSPRTPAQERLCLSYPGGFLLHTGYPNPGIRAVLRRCAARWERSPVPIIVHILAQRGEEVFEITRRLETLENLAALELGMPPEASPALAAELVSAALSEHPVIARLPLEHAEELVSVVIDSGAAAISLGAPAGRCQVLRVRLLKAAYMVHLCFPWRWRRSSASCAWAARSSLEAACTDLSRQKRCSRQAPSRFSWMPYCGGAVFKAVR